VTTVWATSANASPRGSRFVRQVEIRGDRGHVWLKGRRVPTWWVWLHVLATPFRCIWRIVCQSEYAEHAWQTPFFRQSDFFGDAWLSRRMRVEEVSWASAGARLVDTAITPAERDFLVRLKVPVGPDGSMRTLILQTAAANREALVVALSGRSVGML
jgi:hypothetical protein